MSKDIFWSVTLNYCSRDKLTRYGASQDVTEKFLPDHLVDIDSMVKID